jgi:hypothetical protein
VAVGASRLNQRAATPIAGNKEAERPDDEDEDEGVGEEGDHDEEYKRQMEEVSMCCSLIPPGMKSIEILLKNAVHT